jgi:hypothetical protein
MVIRAAAALRTGPDSYPAAEPTSDPKIDTAQVHGL